MSWAIGDLETKQEIIILMQVVDSHMQKCCRARNEQTSGVVVCHGVL